MYYIMLNSLEQRTELIKKFKKQDIHPVFHYIPLHNSPAGKQFARAHCELKQTEQLSERLLRLPLWVGLGKQQSDVLKVLGAKMLSGYFLIGNMLDNVMLRALNGIALI